MKTGRKVLSAAASVFMILLGLCFLIPLYIMVINSFKNRAELYMSPVALPDVLRIENYVEAIDRMNFLTSFSNSLLVTLFSVAFIVLFSSMCAWMLARTDDRKSRFLYFAFVATMLIPFHTLMMPLVQMMKWSREYLGIPVLNTRYGIVFMYIGFGMSLAVFLFALFLAFKKKSHPILIICLSAVIGIAAGYIQIWTA